MARKEVAARRIDQAAGPLRGELTVPGDKSICHRAVIFGGVAEGTTRIWNFSGGEDNQRTVAAFRSLGVTIARRDDILEVRGRGWDGLVEPSETIDCGNSGTTMRLLAGLLAGRPLRVALDGDASLRSRPMRRVVEPLERMGAKIVCRDGLAPLEIRGGGLKGIRWSSPVASAQVKSAILLAGLQAQGETVVEEPQKSRDHTEIMARAFGAALEIHGNAVAVEGLKRLRAREITVPGDLSSSAFFLVAAAMIPGSDIVVKGVGCNPTRTGVIDVLGRMGVVVETLRPRVEGGEPVADLRVVGGKLKGADIGDDMVARTIDEYPLIAVAAAVAEGTTRIWGAGELRHKESDRIHVMTQELRKLGASVEEREDGMVIEGGARLRGARLNAAGDHRVAMALAVAGLAAEGGVEIEGATCADISFPGFFPLLEMIARSS
jgi:3-phosphoshikimate 1-carboxyvinyltransferase